MTLLDELSLKNHIDSVPKILSEMWQMLGESGRALHNSIRWLIESVKSSYNQGLEFISRLFHGEAMTYVTKLLERGMTEYDRGVKDLNLKFIRYVENVWTKVSESVVTYWKRSLERLEPLLLKFLTHIEQVVWSVSREVFGMLS